MTHAVCGEVESQAEKSLATTEGKSSRSGYYCVPRALSCDGVINCMLTNQIGFDERNCLVMLDLKAFLFNHRTSLLSIYGRRLISESVKKNLAMPFSNQQKEAIHEGPMKVVAYH